MAHLDEKQQFSVYLVLMLKICYSLTIRLGTLLKCVSNHPTMKANHDGRKKNGGLRPFCRGRMSSAWLIFMKNSVCERISHWCLFFMDECLVR